MTVIEEAGRFWRDFTGHASPADQFWAGADHDGADLTRLPPASMVTGWWDLFLPLRLRDYAAIRATGVTARITVGPWLHGAPGELKAITRQDIAWLDHHLNGSPSPPGPPVRVFLQKAGTWLNFQERPPPAAVGTVYYLGASGGLSLDAEPGEARPTRSSTTLGCTRLSALNGRDSFLADSSLTRIAPADPSRPGTYQAPPAQIRSNLGQQG